MSNEIENTAATEQVDAVEIKKEPTPDLDEQFKKLSKGKLVLQEPIRAGGKDVLELEYDFQKITGWEYAEAMDSDLAATNTFRISFKQALCLFAASAGKATPGIDATDIRQRIGSADAIKAVQVATVFFVGSTRAGNKRILSA